MLVSAVSCSLTAIIDSIITLRINCRLRVHAEQVKCCVGPVAKLADLLQGASLTLTGAFAKMGASLSPLPATATPSQLGCGQGTRSAQELAAALRLPSRYCSSSSTDSSRGMSASREQHHALGPFGISSPCPASCNDKQHR